MARKRSVCVYPEMEDWMNRKGLTLIEFADMVNSNESTISRFLMGKNICRINTMQNICKVTGLSFVFTEDGGNFVNLDCMIRDVAGLVIQSYLVEQTYKKEEENGKNESIYQPANA